MAIGLPIQAHPISILFCLHGVQGSQWPLGEILVGMSQTCPIIVGYNSYGMFDALSRLSKPLSWDKALVEHLLCDYFIGATHDKL